MPLKWCSQREGSVVLPALPVDGGTISDEVVLMFLKVLQPSGLLHIFGPVQHLNKVDVVNYK